MFEKKNFLLNCDVCDTRKMKEEDYTSYEKMMINADIVLVNETSKSILNRLPLTINQDKMIELSDDVEISIKTINGSYEITGSTTVEEHTILTVNGSLRIHPDTEEILKKYEHIAVNGTVKYPKSMEGFLNKLSVNGSTSAYPDDCIILDKKFVMDKYFPLRVKEGSKYYAEKLIIIQDKDMDISKLVQKNIQFVTKHLIVPECKVEDCVPLFDEQTAFIIVPEDMELICGNITLTEELLRKIGTRPFVYGDLKIDEDADVETICKMLDKLIVKGTVILTKTQQDFFLKIDAEYDKLKISKKGRNIQNMPRVKLDKTLFDNSPDGINIINVAAVTLKDDITPEMILEKLSIENCAKVTCSEEQESAVTAIAKNVANIGHSDDDNSIGGIIGSVLGMAGDLAATKMINADSYIL